MKRLVISSVIFTIAVCAVCCKKGSDSAQGEAKKYEIKSGSFTYSIPLKGFGPVETTTYFDNYGETECTESKVEIAAFGQVIRQHTRSITKDGWFYNLDMTNKTGTKSKIDSASMADMKQGFAAMAVAMKGSMKTEELGTEDVLGKSCRKVKVSFDGGNTWGTFWLWKNITLKMEMPGAGDGGAFTMTATKVEELSSIPADKFNIPGDFVITEEKMPAMDQDAE